MMTDQDIPLTTETSTSTKISVSNLSLNGGSTDTNSQDASPESTTMISEDTLMLSRPSAYNYSHHVASNDPGCVEDKVLYQWKDNAEYQELKRQLQLNEYGMFVFLRVKNLIDAYPKMGFNFIHTRLDAYMRNMEWYNRYVQHHKCNKLRWDN